MTWFLADILMKEGRRDEALSKFEKSFRLYSSLVRENAFNRTSRDSLAHVHRVILGLYQAEGKAEYGDAEPAFGCNQTK